MFIFLHLFSLFVSFFFFFEIDEIGKVDDNQLFNDQ